MSEDAGSGRDSLGEPVPEPKEFREWLLFKRHFGAWSIAPPDGFVYRNDEPVPESVQVIEHAAYIQAIKERDELLKKYRAIELANKEMSRLDHVNFGELLQHRDEARAEVERLKKERHDIRELV